MAQAPNPIQAPQNSQQQQQDYYDPTAGYENTTPGAGYPPADSTNEQGAEPGAENSPVDTNNEDAEQDTDNPIIKRNDDEDPDQAQTDLQTDINQAPEDGEGTNENDPAEQTPTDEEQPQGQDEVQAPEASDGKEHDKAKVLPKPQSQKYSSKYGGRIKTRSNDYYSKNDYSSYYNSQRHSGFTANPGGGPTYQSPCQIGVIPMRSAAFQAPRIPLPKLCNHLLPDGGQEGQEDEDGVAFQFKPQTHCRTEVTFTIEPKPQPPWLTMLNCGFKPMVNCSAPPCYLSPNGNPGMDYMGGTQSVVNQAFGRQVQYCGMANFPTMQQIQNCFPGGKVIDASKKKRGKSSGSESSESESEDNEHYPHHVHQMAHHQRYPYHPNGLPQHHYGHYNNHFQHNHGHGHVQAARKQHGHQRRHPSRDRKKSTNNGERKLSLPNTQPAHPHEAAVHPEAHHHEAVHNLPHHHEAAHNLPHHHEGHHLAHHEGGHHHHHRHSHYESRSSSERDESSDLTRSQDWHL